MITVENQLFSLHTRHTSYLFRVMETGHLEHLYYGRKIHPAIDGLMEQHAFAPGNTNIYDSEHLQFSLEDTCLEMSSFGKGDIREPFVELTLSDDEVRVANNYITEMCNLRKLDPNSYYFIKGGTKTCSGIQAVAYARIRYVGNADYQRTERQRTVLTKMMEKIKDMSLPELYSFAEDVLPLVTHNIPEDEMWSLLAKSPSLLQYKLVKDRIPYDNMYKVIYVKKQDMLVPDWEQTIAKLKETLY